MTTPTTANQNPPASGPLQNLIQSLPPVLNQIANAAQQAFTGSLHGNRLGEGISALIQPPVLRTFVYNPEVKVIIAHNEVEYDISSDVVRCWLTRPENSAASFGATLHNKDLRYTPLQLNNEGGLRFNRMDRIVVYMKKTGWNQVFSGYLDNVPYRQLYPGTVEIKATCTIKRLMHTWFNPDLPQSQTLFSQLAQPDAYTSPDSGLGTMLRNLLTLVGGWDDSNIHIQNFPVSFFNFIVAMKQGNNQVSSDNTDLVAHWLLGSDTRPGPGSYAGANPDSGAPGPSTPGVGGIPGASAGVADGLTLFYVQQIVAACDEKGLGPLVSDNNLSAGLVQAGEIGAGSGGPSQNPGQQKAWQTVQQTNMDAQEANRASDGAIVAVTAALVDTGAGTGIRNLYNSSIPGSDQFANDGPGFGNGVGIFSMPDSAEWGNVAQRMNPKQAAGMWFAKLDSFNWRNMAIGEAAQMVQRSGMPEKYAVAADLAIKLVQQYRKDAAGTGSTVVAGPTVATGVDPTQTVINAAGSAPSVNPNLVVGPSGGSPQPVVNPGVVSPTATAKPQPDSEGAINFATTQFGQPYEWGGTGPGYDCSGLVSQAFKSIGIFVPHSTDDIRGNVPKVPNESVQRGDIVEPTDGHVVIWCGDGTIIEAPQQGGVVQRIPNPYGAPATWAFVGRACLNGGIDPTSPFNPPATMGPGTPPSALHQTGGPLQTGSSGVNDSVARNFFGWQFTGQYTSQIAQAFHGKLAFIVGVPLIQVVQQVCAAGLRSWSSGPNGDFIAWYPDYWGLDGKPCVLRLEDIELVDVNIQFSDDQLTTHAYVAGDNTLNAGATGEMDPVTMWLNTGGVITCEDADQWLYQRLIQIAPWDENLSGTLLMKRYGIRPQKLVVPIAGKKELELLIAIKLFLQKWAEQYLTTISMTFMPELFPGMRVELGGDKNLQVYVTSVTHTCDYESGFATQASIMAPSIPQAKKLMAAVKTVQGPSDTLLSALADGALPTVQVNPPQRTGV